MRTVFAAGLVLALAWLAAPASADAPRSLGEVAAKDAKDKEKNKKKAKVYTEDDLHNAGRGGTVSQPGSEGSSALAGTSATEAKKEGDKTAVTPAGDGQKPKTEDEQRADDEKKWRDEVAQAQADVNTWTAEVARLQSQLNDRTGPLYGPGRAARTEALENAKRQLAAAQQTLADLQERGRRSRFR